jgi:hypothetical protein
MFPGNLGLFFEESSLFPKEVAFPLENLSPSPGDNSLLPKEIIFFLEELKKFLMKIIIRETSFIP